MKLITLLTTLFLFSTTVTHAAIFDAPDFLAPGSSAVGGFGEILLSDPTSEGIEGRFRHGINESWNMGAIVGSGSKNKKFRIGTEAVLNMIDDADGDFGFSGLFSAIYLKREFKGGVVFRAAPVVHKRMVGFNGLPARIYAGLPFSVEARSGNYTTGTQIVLGAIADMDTREQFYLVADAGIKLGKTESYVLLGAGFRFDAEITVKEREPSSRYNKRGRGPDSRAKDNSGEYRTEDFE